MIYGEVFQYKGELEFLNPMSNALEPRDVFRSLAYDRQFILNRMSVIAKRRWDLPLERSDVTDLTGNILSMPLVNRQIFEEAMPVFYNINTFYVKDIYRLARMLRLCGGRRRVYFSRIELFHASYAGTTAMIKKTFAMLAEAKQLQCITVRCRDVDDSFPALNADDSRKTIWIELLCDLKCKSVEITGDCPQTETYMREYRLKKAFGDCQVESRNGKSVTVLKRSKKVYKSEALVQDDT